MHPVSRDRRRFVIIIIALIIWTVLFIGQTIYFSSPSSFPRLHCWFVMCHKTSRIDKHKINAADDRILTLVRRQPLLQQYAIAPHHVNFVRLIHASLFPSNKYLVYTCNGPCGGWGDRTRKIVGAYLLALALNRIFIINITWPCSIEHLLEPNFIQWNRTIKDSHKRTNVTVHILGASDSDYQHVLAWQNIDIIYFKIKDLGFYSMLLWRDDFYRTLRQQYGFHRSTLFIHTVFTLVYELLFKLKPHPQSHLNDIAVRHHSSPLICAHLRIGRNPSNPNDMIFPRRERMNVTVIRFLKNQSMPNNMIFVTTDSEEVRTYAERQFGSRLLKIEGIIRHIDRSGKKLACDALEKTILDFYMIAQCQTMVMSKSAFSFWANMRRLKPYKNLYLYCDGIKTIRGPGDYDRFPYGQC